MNHTWHPWKTIDTVRGPLDLWRGSVCDLVSWPPYPETTPPCRSPPTVKTDTSTRIGEQVSLFGGGAR
jgi:hypothetical protein